MQLKSLLTVLLPLLFLLPCPILGQTSIIVDTILTAPHMGSISIDADNITLDCGGNDVTGPGSAGIGIDLSERIKVTVKNCHVHFFEIGFNLFESDRNEFHYNTAENNRRGFNLFESDRNEFHYNTVEFNSFRGFNLFESDRNTFTKNTVDNNTRVGFRLQESNNNTLTQNTATGNFRGFNLGTSDKNKLTKNTADNNGRTGFRVRGESERNTFIRNQGCNNTDFDALDESTGLGNIWNNNDFCTCSGLPDACP